MLRDRFLPIILIAFISFTQLSLVADDKPAAKVDPALAAYLQESSAPTDKVAAEDDAAATDDASATEEVAADEAAQEQPKQDDPAKSDPALNERTETPAQPEPPAKTEVPAKEEAPAKSESPAKTDTPAKEASKEDSKEEAKEERPATAPLVQVTQTQTKKEERNIRFHFDGMPYTDVIKRFSQMSGKAMMGEYKMDGSLTFIDSEPYTYSEAKDVLNTMLAQRGFWLQETDNGRYLRLISVGDLPLWVRIYSGMDEAIAAGTRPNEVVTVMLPVKHIDVETASKAVVPMVSIYGRISPLARGKGILLTDSLKSIDRIRRIIAMMDDKSEEEQKLDLKSYVLKKAAAANASSVINNLLRGGRSYSSSRDPRESSTTAYRAGDSVIYASADERSNILIVRGTKDMIELADQLVLMLDEGNPDAGDPIKVFGLKTAGARDVASAIQTIVGGRDGRRIYVYGDTTMNSVLVRAGIEDMPVVEKLIQDLDGNVKELNTVRAFPLKFTTATAISEVLRTVLAPRDVRGERTFGNIAISADASTNTIYVSGPAAVIENAAKMIIEIDKFDGESRQLHVVTNLGQSSAVEMATQISEMYQKQYGTKASPQIMPTIQAIASSNTLLVSCLDSQWENVKSVIDTIKDVAIPTNVAESRIIALKHARASELAETLKTVYSAPRRTTASRAATPGAEMPPVIVTASDRNNSLVVSAAADDQKSIADLVALLDVPAAENVDPVRIVQLSEAADAATIAQTLIGMIPPATAKEKNVFIQADTGSNSIIFRAPESERNLMEQLITKLDELAPQNARETRMLPLDKASATQLLPMLTQLYAPTPAAGAKLPDPADRIVIAAAPGDKLLLIDAPRKKIEEIAALIKSMDQENSPVAQEMRTYALEKASAVGMVQALTAMFPPSAEKTAELPPRISAEGTTLIVLATQQQHTVIEKVIKDVEATRVVGSTTKRFRLANARAIDVAPAIEAMLIDKTQRAASTVPGRDVPETRVVAVDITNDIVVQGPIDKITLAEMLIKDFDDPDAQKTVIIQMVRLKNAQAASMAEVVNAVMAAQVKPAAVGTPAVSDDNVTVSADPNSNSVLVRGPFDRVMEAVKMIEKLDSESDANSSKIKMYQLKNGDAAALAKTLDEIFKAMIAQAPKGKNVSPPSFTVGADPRTNKLVVSTTPGYFALVEEIIESLDNPQERINREAQYFFLKNAWATDVATQIDATFADRKTDKPVILADSFTESISVIATPEDMKTIEELVLKLDAGAKAPDDLGRIVEVRNMGKQSAVKIAEMLKTLYSQQSGGKVIVTDKLPASAIPKPETNGDAPAPTPAPQPKDAPPAEPKDSKPSARADEPMGMPALAQSIADDVMDGIEPPTEFVNAQAAPTPPNVKTIEVPEPESGPIPDVIIAVDEASNSLIISGTRKQLADIDSLIAKFTTTDAASEDLDFRVFGVRHSDPETLAQVLNSLFNARFLNQQQQMQGGNAMQQQIFQMMQQQLMQQMGGRGGRDDGGDDPVSAALERSGVLQRGGNNNQQGGNNRNARGNQQQQQAAPTVIIVADKRTNRIIARGKPTDLDLVGQVISQIDTSTTVASVVRVFPLKNTDAREVATNITAMFSGSGGTRGASNRAVMIRAQIEKAVENQLGPEPVDMASIISITSNQQTNSVIATAPAEAMDIIAQIIQEIDQSAAAAATPTVQMYPIKNADLIATVSNLQKIYAPLTGGNGPGGSGRVTITADAASNTIIVAASPDQQAVISKVIDDIDNAQPAGELEIKVYKIVNAEATSVANTLVDMLMPGSSGTQLNANALQWLAGPRSQRGAAPSADATPGAMRISADASSNSLVIRASKEMHEKIAELIAKIDVPVTATQPLQLVSLEHADPVNVAQILTRFFAQQQSINIGRGNFSGFNNQRQPIVIEGDRKSKKLIVRADEETFKRVEELAKELDVATPTGDLTRRLVVLQHAPAQSVAAALTEAFAPTSTSRASTAGNFNLNNLGGNTAQSEDPDEIVTVVAEPTSNSIIITANEGNHKKIDELLVLLDTDKRGGLVTEFYIVRNTSAQDMATALDRVARNRTGVTTQRGSNTTTETIISADRSSNALIFSGPATDVERFKKMAMALDVEKEDTETGIEVIPIRNGNAFEIANTINSLFRSVATNSLLQGGGAGGGASKFAVSADSRSNSVIVVADQMTRTQIRFTINHLETISPQRGQPRMISLQYADPADVQRAINAIYGGQDTSVPQQNQNFNRGGGNFQQGTQGNQNFNRGGGNFNQGNQGNQGQQNPTFQPGNNQGGNQFNRGGNQGGNQGNRGGNQNNQGGRGNQGQRSDLNPAGSTMTTRSTADRVSATPVPNSGSILIDAGEEDYEAILKLVAMMEEAAKGQQRMTKVIILERANNQRIAQAIQQVFGTSTRPEDRVGVTSLVGTNAVVVAAVEAKMPEVEALIKQLDDRMVVPQVEFRIFTLKNSTPSKMLPLVRNMLAKVDVIRQDDSFDVQADDRSRSLIVTAKTNVFEQVGKVIELLDQAPAHEAAEVMIVQLKRADATRMAAVLSEMLQQRAGTTTITPEAQALQEQVRLLKVMDEKGEKAIELDLTKPIKIVADPINTGEQGANALIISGTPDNLKALSAVIAMMDTVPVTEDVKVHLVHLKRADAQSVATILTEVFTQGQKLAGKAGTSTEGKAEPEDPTGKAIVNPLNVSADLRTNSLVLSGKPETLELALKIATDLDREAGKFVTEVRLFQLAHAKASDVAPLLSEVFTETQQQGGGANNQNQAVAGMRAQATQLWMKINEKEVLSEFASSRPALTVRADDASQTLVIAARSDVMPIIADVIKSLDVPSAGAGNLVRFIPLTNADATRIKTMIDSLYTGQNAQNVRETDIPTISVDTRTNTLVVAASEKTFMIISAMIKQVDKQVPVELKEIKLVKLQNAEASSLAPILQTAMDQRVEQREQLGDKDAESLRMLIASDPRSNSLIVAGSQEGFKLVESLAEQLDNAGPALATQIQVVPLKEANAGLLSTTLQQLFDQRYAAATTPDVQRQKPTFLADLRTNSLLMAANNDDTKVITGLLAKMDVKQANPAVDLFVVGLKHNDAGSVGPALTAIFQARQTANTLQGAQPSAQDQVAIQIDALSNALIISASKDNMALIQSLLLKVDVEPPANSGVVRMYPLVNSDASRISQILQDLVTQGLYKPGAATSTTQNQAVANRDKIAVQVDTRTNVLIVSASKENFAVVEEIIKQLDSSKDYGVLGDMRMFVLKNADATRLAPTLQEIFDKKRAAEQAVTGTAPRSLAVSIIAEPRTNTLLVGGSAESFAAVEAMIKELDGAQVPAASQFKVFEVKDATVTVLQPMLQELFTNRVVRGDSKDAVTVLADARTRSIIVGASAEDMLIAEGLIKQLDKARNPDMDERIYPLRKADATQVLTTLRDLYNAENAAAGTTTTGVTMSAQARINSIVVRAGSADHERISSLITKLDAHNVQRVMEIKVVVLKQADATELATILNDILTKKAVDPNLAGTDARQTLLQHVAKSESGKQIIAEALQEGVMISAETRSNSLIVTAPIDYMPLLTSLIRSLDQTPPKQAEIRMFKLKNADATQMATTLSEVFTAGNGTAAAANGTTGKAINYVFLGDRQFVDKDGNVAAPVEATVGTAEQDALRVTIDSRTNTLLVGGTPEHVLLVSRIVEQLDDSPALERKTEVFRLRNGQALDIEAALRNFLDQERTRLTQTLGNDKVGAAQRLAEQDVSIVAEPTSNSLLISASPRYYDQVRAMVDKLDDPKPQVLIQVLLAEVTLDDSTDLGFDFQVTKGVGNYNVQGGTDFGIQQAIQQFGGMGVSVTGGDFSFFLRALQAQGKLEVLSRPQILASDNQPANINVGQRVPFVTNSSISDTGNVVNTIQYEDVGILLNVTARISDDGFVNMDVSPEISSLSNSSVQVSETVSAPIISNRSAATRVTVQDGQTIVVGGLITTTDEQRVSKVPILGDIPLIKYAFQSTNVSRQRTELLIILTPRILYKPSDAAEITRLNRERMEQVRKIKLEEAGKATEIPFDGLGPLRDFEDKDGKAPVRPESGPARSGNSVPGNVNLSAPISTPKTEPRGFRPLETAR